VHASDDKSTNALCGQKGKHGPFVNVIGDLGVDARQVRVGKAAVLFQRGQLGPDASR